MVAAAVGDTVVYLFTGTDVFYGEQGVVTALTVPAGKTAIHPSVKWSRTGKHLWVEKSNIAVIKRNGNSFSIPEVCKSIDYGDPVFFNSASEVLASGNSIQKGAVGFVIRGNADGTLQCWFEHCPNVKVQKSKLGMAKVVTNVQQLVRMREYNPLSINTDGTGRLCQPTCTNIACSLRPFSSARLGKQV